MDGELSRRALFGSMVAAGVAGVYLSPARRVLDQFAPLSGSVWESANPRRPETVESPYGEATLRYDDEGVPHISADNEQALYFAVGHTQAIDRGLQMDLQRRQFSGTLAEVVGSEAVESDRFHRKLCFREAAEATVSHLEGTEAASILAAYADGVTAGFEDGTLELGFQLLGYEPEPWTPVDTIVVEKIIAWTLTGSFRTLRRALVRDNFGEELTEQLYRARFDYDAPIIRERHLDEQFQTADTVTSERHGPGEPVDADTVDWLTQFEPEANLGSNSWVFDGGLTASGDPILSNDPHLSLQAPPVWYEMHLDGPDHRVRGVAFPGVPFVIIGETDFAAWGFTNATNDVIDFYQYNHGADIYFHDGERRQFEREEQTIEVASGSNETVTVEKTVHGPVIEESERKVAVSWTGHAATETTLAIYELTHSESFEETLTAIEKFDSPTQNFLYADQDGNTLYYMIGRTPIRSPDGELVSFDDDSALSGDQIFDGSAREGEWVGFEPFERPSWEGFVPFEELPHVINPDYLATANQEIIRDEHIDYYLAEAYADPYRGERIYELIDERVENGEPIDMAFLERLGRDTYDGRAEDLVEPLIEVARDADERQMRNAADILAEWDYQMDKDSKAALLFSIWMDHYRDTVLGEPFEEVGLDEQYYPRDGRIARLPADSGWFGPAGRRPVMRRALRNALEEIEKEGYETYGDIAHTGQITHLAGLDFLTYPSIPRGGSGSTVWNFGHGGPWGGGWEMQVDLGGEYRAILAGGNSGRYFSPHYDDQIERWATGEYRRLSREVEGKQTTEFVGEQ